MSYVVSLGKQAVRSIVMTHFECQTVLKILRDAVPDRITSLSKYLTVKA